MAGMTNRGNLDPSTLDFLREAGWKDFEILPMKADFSTRRFDRLRRESGDPTSAVLMQAGRAQKSSNFLAIAALLRRAGVQAPMIYAHEVEFDSESEELFARILMQDLGALTLGDVCDSGEGGTDFVMQSYAAATDVLIRLHRNFDLAWRDEIALPVYDSELFAEQVAPFLDYYIPFAREVGVDREARDEFFAAWLSVLRPLDALPQSLLLRDYMLDNLVDRRDEDSLSVLAAENIGVIDFQDAGIGPIVYDLASLAETVRRDPPPPYEKDDVLCAVLARYHEAHPVLPLPILRDAAYVFAAQRHMRILGRLIFLHKMQMVPRVLAWLRVLLEKPPLDPVLKWFQNYDPLFLKGEIR